jgi:hypothetical protein
MSEIRENLLVHCLKPDEINGDADTKDARVKELVYWFARYADGRANPKWVTEHAMELAHYCAEIKGL